MSTPTMIYKLRRLLAVRVLQRGLAAIGLILLCALPLHGQTLIWAPGGVGGDGAWDAIANNWFNGSQFIPWSSNGDAVFGGPMGTVSVGTSPVIAKSMTFNTPGFLVQNNSVLSGSSGLTITANADATISCTIDRSVTAGNHMTKSGPAALIVSGTNSIGNINVDQGEYRITANSNLSFANITFANDPSAIVTLGQSGNLASFNSLNGGGALGGRVQPNDQARTVTLTLRSTSNFAGSLQDNGSGKLALQLQSGGDLTGFTTTNNPKIIFGSFTGNGNALLTNPNTFSGATTIDSGNLVLSGGGSMLNSPITSSSLGSFVIDNSRVPLANRVSDTLPFAMENTRVQFTGNSTTPVEELVGNAVLTGAASLTINKPGAAATLLSFSGLTRNARGTLNIVGNGLAIGGLANDVTGTLPTMFTVGNDWATLGVDGRITAYDGYAADINSSLTTHHVKISATGVTSLVATTTRASLNLLNANAASDQTLDLGGHNLSLTSGGLLQSGSGASTIRNGAILTLAPEMIMTTNNALSISAALQQQSSAATALVKTGPGKLTLSGINTYAGNTAILQGTLAVGSDANLGAGSTIEFGGGKLSATGNFSSTKGFSKTSPLAGTIDTNGFNVAFSGTNTGAINKIGAGTLTLSNANTGTTFLTEGTLALTNPTSAIVLVNGGTLQASGTVFGMTLPTTTVPNFVLDPGGPAAASLTTTFFMNGFRHPFTMNFGIGSAAKDLWTITNSAFLSGPIAFEFSDLGGVTTGIDYTLINFPIGSSGPFFPTSFVFAPDMAAAGWAGTFKANFTSVSVRFTAVPVPEPTTTVLLLLEGAGLTLYFRRRRTLSGRHEFTSFLE